MGDAKRLIVKPIAAKDANRIVQSLHYSGKTARTSTVHLGVFLDGKCGGAMQFGGSINKRGMLGLVEGTNWNEFIELNRMAFSDWLPRNSESRAIAAAMRFIRKQYSWIKWVVSFADGCQCGDGTIYRASGFVLTAIRPNTTMWKMATGEVVADQVFGLKYGDGMSNGDNPLTRYGKKGTESRSEFFKRVKAERLQGFQLRYIYFLDPTARERLTVPILPFSEIDRRGAGMYKGKPRVRSVDSDTSGDQPEMGGANPTRTLHTPEVTE